MKGSALPGLAFAGCALVWGSTFLAIRIGDETVPALWACALRLFLAAALLTAIHAAMRQPWPRGSALTAACLYGFLEFGVGLPLLYWGEKAVSSGMSAVLYALSPIAAMAAARAFGMEKWNPAKLGAAALSVCGVAAIFWQKVLEGASPAGYAAITLAAIAGPVAGLFLQRGPRQNAVAANAIGAWVGLPFAFIASVLAGESRGFPSTAKQIYPIVYLAVMSSGFAFVLFAWLINHWKTTTVSFLGVVVPVLAVCVGAVVLHESFSPQAMAGSAVVLVGVVIALRADAAKIGLQTE